MIKKYRKWVDPVKKNNTFTKILEEKQWADFSINFDAQNDCYVEGGGGGRHEW